jgi:hypothetical protein
MNIGILRDFDPEVRKQSAERAKLIRILADHWGYSFAEAEDWLDYEDDLARRLFAVGNTYPRSYLN